MNVKRLLLLLLLPAFTFGQGVVSPRMIKQGGATSGQCLQWNGSVWAPADCGGSPAGSATEYQYRNAGSLGAGTLWECPSNVIGFSGCAATNYGLREGTAYLEAVMADGSAQAEFRALKLFSSASGIIGFAGRSALTSAVDGNLRLSNAAGTDFSLLQFGGTTSSFPALKSVTGPILRVKTADDSAWADMEANIFRTPQGGYFATSGWGAIQFPEASVLRLTGDGTGFQRLQFGGGTASYPALKRNAAGLEARLADDSAYTTIAASVVNGVTGFQVNGAASTGQYLRGNGTNFVSSTIQTSDLPDLSATYQVVSEKDVANGYAGLNASGQLTADTTGNAATATALAANGTNCATGEFPKGVDASGNAEGCAALTDSDVPDTITASNYQPEPATSGLVARTAADTSAARTITGTTNEITITNGDGVSGNPTLSIADYFRITGKSATAPVKTGTTAPASCTIGDLFYDTDATAGQNLFGCTATDTWTLLGDGGGSGSGDVTGPSSSDDNYIVVFDGTTGKIIKENVGSCRITVADGLRCGDGTTAGEVKLYELSANGSNYFSWLGQDSRTTDLRVKIPSADPTASQVMLFGAPSSSISTATWGGLNDISGTLGVAKGGTGLTAGTSGGVPYFNSTSTMASSAALGQYQVVLGGGAGAAPTTVSGTGTSGQVLTSNGASAAPTWQDAAAGSSLKVDSTNDGMFLVGSEYLGGSTNYVTTGSANRVMARQFVLPFDMDVSEIAFNIAGYSGAGIYAAFAIYDSSGSLVAQTGTVETSADGAYTVSFSSTQSLSAGVYFLAWTTTSATLRFSGQQASTFRGILNANESSTTMRMFYASNASTGTSTLTFPSTFGTRSTSYMAAVTAVLKP